MGPKFDSQIDDIDTFFIVTIAVRWFVKELFYFIFFFFLNKELRI